jgi:hypothetical protein
MNVASTCHDYAPWEDKSLVPSGSHDNGTIRYRSRWLCDRSSTGPLCRGSPHIVPVPAWISTEYHQRHFTRGKVSQATEVATSGRSGIHRILVLCFTCSMIQTEMFPTVEGELAMREPSQTKRNAPSDMPSVIERLATISSRPRYAFMVLNLIARAAGESGEAGPYVVEKGNAVRLRDWLCDALSPMARRDPRRIALTERVRIELEGQEGLPKDSEAAADAIDRAVRLRVRASGRCNVSRAVSELVRAGLVRRHYQGWRVDHHNRGARREAVYTLTAEAVRSLRNSY